MQIGSLNLNHRAQFFVKQNGLVAQIVYQALHGKIVLQIDVHAKTRGKRHLRQRGKQAAVAAVVIRQQFVFAHQLLNQRVKRFQAAYIVHIGRCAAQIVPHLPQRRAAHPRLAKTQINQQQHAVFHVFQLGRNRLAHILHGRKRRHNQRQRRHYRFLLAALLPHGFHGKAVLAHGNAHAQRLAHLRHGFHRAIQFFVFACHAAGCHPVGGKFDVADVADVGGGKVGNRLAKRHAPRSRRVCQRQRGFFAHAHRFAARGIKAHQCHGAVGNGGLPHAHHLVAVG